MKRAALLSFLSLASLSVASAKVNDRDAVRAIIGEGANQSDEALAGIASAIHTHAILPFRNSCTSFGIFAMYR
jgi:hypothetical protein